MAEIPVKKEQLDQIVLNVSQSLLEEWAIADRFTEKLLNAGFNNKIRITDVSDSCYSNGPYIRVVAELP